MQIKRLKEYLGITDPVYKTVITPSGKIVSTQTTLRPSNKRWVRTERNRIMFLSIPWKRLLCSLTVLIVMGVYVL